MSAANGELRAPLARFTGRRPGRLCVRCVCAAVDVAASFRRDEPLFVPPPLLVSARHRRHERRAAARAGRRPAVGFCCGIRRAVGRASTSGVQRLRSAWTRVLAVSASAALVEHGTTDLSAVVASVLLSCAPLLSLDTVISGTSLQANEQIAEASRELLPQPTPPLSTSRNLLAMDPGAFVQFLKTARPEPVAAENKARALSSLPEEGEVTKRCWGVSGWALLARKFAPAVVMFAGLATVTGLSAASAAETNPVVTSRLATIRRSRWVRCSWLPVQSRRRP